MAEADFSPARIPAVHLNPTAKQAVVAQALRGVVVAQEASAEGSNAWIDEGTFNPVLLARRFETLETRRRRSSKEEEASKTEKKEELILEVQRIEEVSEQFHRQNPELQKRSLQLLRSMISQQDTKEEILRKVLEMYPDYSLADEALDFLLETTEGYLARQVRLAKEDLNALYGREVRAGKNMAAQAREFSSKGLGSPTGLRGLYREVTGNPCDPNTLFEKLSSQFPYEKMKTVIDFLLHSLGGDLKSKGPSIDRGELHRLLSETRTLQGILGVFRFFEERMDLIRSAFARNGLSLPLFLNFELLAKQLMRTIQERYPAAAKILLLATHLGLSEELLAQIIVFTQMKDALRQIAPKLFKSDQQRLDLSKAFIDAIEQLDEKLEEEEEKKETP